MWRLCKHREWFKQRAVFCTVRSRQQCVSANRSEAHQGTRGPGRWAAKVSHQVFQFIKLYPVHYLLLFVSEWKYPMFLQFTLQISDFSFANFHFHGTWKLKLLLALKWDIAYVLLETINRTRILSVVIGFAKSELPYSVNCDKLSELPNYWSSARRLKKMSKSISLELDFVWRFVGQGSQKVDRT